MAFDLASARGDMASILSDWSENVTIQRGTDTTITGAAGETTQAWATVITTGCDAQPTFPRFTPLKTLSGTEFRPELVVYFKHGTDVRVGDRFTFTNDQYLVRFVFPGDEDKVQVFASRKARIDG